MLKFIADKKPAHWRANLGIAVLAPPYPDGTIIQMLNPYAGGVADILDDLAPGFRTFVMASGYLDQLDPLYSRRGNYALQAIADKLVGVPGF